MEEDSDHRPAPPHAGFDEATAVAHEQRRQGLHALHVLEYALAAPAPRRQRTWLHRVTAAVEALGAVLDEQIRHSHSSTGLLSAIMTQRSADTASVTRLRDEQLGLRIAVASLREQIEPDPEMPIDAAGIRERLARITARYREYLASETDLVYDALHIDLTRGDHDHPDDGCQRR